MFKRLTVLILTGLLIWPIVATRAASPLSTAIAYLQSNYTAQAAANQDWAAIALGENGVSVNSAATNTESLLSTERNVLARAAQGTDRASQISQIEAAYSADQFGSPNLINDDIFGVLAVASSDQNWLNSHQGVFTTIANSQRTDGSFGFSGNGSGDGDITAAALWAMSLANSRPSAALANAASFLHQCQNADGGYGVLPGQTSSIATSSWAMIAQTTLGEDSSAVRNYLFASEQSGGYWLQGDSANYLNTTYAAMALSGQKLPFVKPSASSHQPSAGNNLPSTNGSNNQPNIAPKNTAKPANSGQLPVASSQLLAPAKPPAKRVIRRQIIRTTTTTTYQVYSCSASASASASGGSATASASASCN